MTTACTVGDRARVLVVTSVHHPDDPRIRRRTVTPLAREFTLRYATMSPGPAHGGDHEWVDLGGGGRVRRWLVAARTMWARDIDAISIHDVELVPAGLLVQAVRGIPVVLDLHEDAVAVAATHPRLGPVRRQVAARTVALLLGVVERRAQLTLAEVSYHSRLTGRWPVIPNHPVLEDLPECADDGGYVVYLGDVTTARGVDVAVRACRALSRPRRVVVVGRCRADVAARLRASADRADVDLELRGWVAHPGALKIVAAASVAVCPLLDRPNYRHSLPTKVLEYLACGVPVAASDLPGTAAVVGGLEGVRLVPPGDVDALTEAIGELANPAVRRRTQLAAERVAARFGFDDQPLLSVYRDVLRTQ